MFAGGAPQRNESAVNQAVDNVSKLPHVLSTGTNGPLPVLVTVPSGQSSSRRSTNAQQTCSRRRAGPQDEVTNTPIDTVRGDVLPSIPAPTYLTGTTAGCADFTAQAVQQPRWLIAAVVPLPPTIKMLAVGVAVAVLIDASVLRMILVPAVMSALGEHVWWLPRWLRRLGHRGRRRAGFPARAGCEPHPRRVRTDGVDRTIVKGQDDSGKGFRDDDRTRTAAGSGL